MSLDSSAKCREKKYHLKYFCATFGLPVNYGPGQPHRFRNIDQTSYQWYVGSSTYILKQELLPAFLFLFLIYFSFSFLFLCFFLFLFRNNSRVRSIQHLSFSFFFFLSYLLCQLLFFYQGWLFWGFWTILDPMRQNIEIPIYSAEIIILGPDRVQNELYLKKYGPKVSYKKDLKHLKLKDSVLGMSLQSYQPGTFYIIFNEYSDQTLVHELGHVVIWIFEHIGTPINSKTAEPFCYLFDYLYQEAIKIVEKCPKIIKGPQIEVPITNLKTNLTTT